MRSGGAGEFALTTVDLDEETILDASYYSVLTQHTQGWTSETVVLLLPAGGWSRNEMVLRMQWDELAEMARTEDDD